MNPTQIPGSRWWRFDFHNHTPASSDFHPAEKDTLQPRDWLLAYMRASVDAVVVCDHNTAAWVTQLREALAALAVEQPPEWRPLTLFPGLEISTNEGVHLLAIFGPGTPRQTLDGLLGKLTGWAASKPNHEQQCEQSAVLVAKAIHESGGLAVAAHADKPRGIFVAAGVTGRSLESLLPLLDAIELHDPQGSAAQAAAAHWRGRAVVAGSDSPHRTSNAGRRCTWVKVSRPELAGLRLALLDPELALLPAAPGTPPPALGGVQWIRSLHIENLYLRRQPLQLDFNPAYNAVIGGRGSGKSTVIECLRLVLARDTEIEATGDETLKQNFFNFKRVAAGRNESGMLLPGSRLVAEVQSGPEPDDRLRFEWQGDAKGVGSLKVSRPEGGGWVDTGLAGAEQARAAFPVRIFSQKQVLALARHPQALLGLIDETLGPAKAAWQQAFDAARARLRQARVQLRALRAESVRKPALELEHRTASRKALVFKNANFGPLLQGHQRATRQQRAMGDFHRLLEQDVATLRRALDETALMEQTALSDFESVTDADAAVLEATVRLRDALAQRRTAVAAQVADMESLLSSANAALAGSEWQTQVQAQLAAYAAEMQRLKAEGIDSAQEAAVAVAAVDRLAQKLATIAQFESRIPAAETELALAEEALLTARLQLTTLREDLLQRVFASDASLKVVLRGMANADESVALKLRELLGLSERDKWPAIWEAPEEADGLARGLLVDATRGDWATDVGQRLLAMKRGLEEGESKVLDTRIGAKLDQRLKALPPERFDELAGWFPDDEVTLNYRPSANGEYRTLKQASDGQRAAAMLSFLLAQGKQPLLLDQPEDDLDNALVSELVVKQIREGKQARQLIVVTHNPNIVVNGDAELVLRMQFRSGNIQPPDVGGLQERQVRESICEVMEGGRPAFEQRYKRVLKDLNNLEQGTAGK
jgi:ABC-type lipoprotein export system ATPase subunit